MAWKYPRYDIRAGFVADIDAINENFLAVVDETSGSLNEHNFDSSRTVLRRRQIAPDGAFSLHTTKSGESVVPSEFVKKTGWQEIQQVDDWQTFTGDGSTLHFVGRGALTYICASFQLIATDGQLSRDQKGFGFAVALRVDGTLIFDSLLGSGDSSSEFYRGFKNRGGNLDTSSGDSRNKICSPQGGGGLSGARTPVSIDTVTYLSPGPHKVEIAIMNIRGNSRSSSSDDLTYLASREIFAMEMLR